jgi:hypothetical protein
VVDMSTHPKTEMVKTSELRPGDIVWHFSMRIKLADDRREWEGQFGTTYAFKGLVLNARDFDRGASKADDYIASFMRSDNDHWTVQGNDNARWSREVEPTNDGPTPAEIALAQAQIPAGPTMAQAKAASAAIDSEILARKHSCDMLIDCQAPITMIDAKGYLYCASHGLSRRQAVPCRKLRSAELRKLIRGEQISKY